VSQNGKILSFDALQQVVDRRPKRRVALAAADDPVLLAAAARAQSEGSAEFILVGDPVAILHHLQAMESPVHFEIVGSDNPGPDAVNLVREERADLLMKGHLPTSALLKAVLDRESGLRQGERLNHIAVVQSPRYRKLLFITDGGINLHFDAPTVSEIVENSVRYVSRFGVHDPRVALLTLVEEKSDKIPETLLAAEVAAHFKDRLRIEGPIALDVALSAEAAEQKGITSKIAGKTDILVVANTLAANSLVKGLTALGNCLVGGIVVGAQVPIILLSRSDSIETKYRSILLGLL